VQKEGVMLHILFGNPPLPPGGNTMTEGEIVAFLVTVSVFLVAIAITSAIIGITGRKRVQMASQMKDAQHLDAARGPQGSKEPLVVPQQEKKEPLVRIPSLT
jgi:hypothetical protein